jgi:pseudouridine-5'-phosphate glycosidase
MTFHTPIVIKQTPKVPAFMVRNGELVVPKNVYTKEEYPNLPCDMVKIVGRDGKGILIPYHKLNVISDMDA